MLIENKLVFTNHYYIVPPTPEGVKQYHNHLLAGNEAVIVSCARPIKLIKRNADYISLSKSHTGRWWFKAGYKNKVFITPGTLRLIEPGYHI